jgi:hypothetical protein
MTLRYLGREARCEGELNSRLLQISRLHGCVAGVESGIRAL